MKKREYCESHESIAYYSGLNGRKRPSATVGGVALMMTRQEGNVNMQHGLENTRKVKIKWNETDANYDTFYYHVPLIYGGWIATKEGQAFTRQQIDDAEYSISLYVNDEIVKNRCKEVTEWKETVRLAKNIVIEGYASELDEKDEDYIMQVLHERRYI